jgi:hypothetical protein
MKFTLIHRRDGICQHIICAIHKRIIRKSRLYRLVDVEYINVIIERPWVDCGAVSIWISIAGSAFARNC